jgi:ferritin-like metal-binding protein YciE
MAFGFARRLCHTPYICRRINDFESQAGPFPGLFLPQFPIRSIAVFSSLSRNILSQEHPFRAPVILRSASNIERAVPAGNLAPCAFPQQRTIAMGLFTKDIKTMNDLFIHQLQDIYYAEKQLVKALPKMAEKATDKQLKQGFLSHLDETRTHVQRLEEVFRMHGAQVKAVDCPAIDGIIEEADDVAGEIADKDVLDAALINAAQAAEHYEITRYGSLIAWARQLGRNDCAAILQSTLDEEKTVDKKLTSLAEGKVNLRAAS